MMKLYFQKLLDKLPYIRGLRSEVDAYYKNACFPVRHYYSPIVNIDEIERRQNQVWPSKLPDYIEGIDLDKDSHKQLIDSLSINYNSIPFKAEKSDGCRYYYNNIWFTYNDAIFLHLMLRHIKPKRMIEVGSGFSSAVTLDTNNLFLQDYIQLTFIEPDLERLNLLLKNDDSGKVNIVNKQIQDVDTNIFKELNSGDILFIDTSHICKSGSDLNFILFEILPILNQGVIIHFHDIFYPFEYPKKWVLGRYNWNEIYIMRAFLMYNNKFKIKFFPSYVQNKFPEWLHGFPDVFKSDAQSIWIEKI